MSNSIYNEEYYRQGCGSDYSDKEIWEPAFGRIADAIIRDFNPRSVLDAGCAWGYLVAALRDRGVEAWGVDISDYAISKVRDDIKAYCAVGSLTEDLPEPLPKKYDLVITVEVLEHLTAEDGKRAIARLSGYADTVIVSSTPDDFDEPTHINVQQPEYWISRFAECGLFRDPQYKLQFLPKHAFVVQRRELEAGEFVRKYELALRTQKKSYISSKVYFSGENGESEDNTFVFTSELGQPLNERVRIPAGCRRIRFDPIDGVCSFLWNVKATTERAPLTPFYHNAIKLGEVYAYGTTDPQLFFDLPEGTQWVDLSCEVSPMYSCGWAYLFEEIKTTLDSLASSNNTVREREAEIASLLARVAALDSEVSSLSGIRAELQATVERLSAEAAAEREAHALALAEKDEQHKAAFEEAERRFDTEREALKGEITALTADAEMRSYKLEEYERELEHYKLHYHAAIAQREELKRDLANVQAMYNNVAGAFFWKITKPARFLLDIFKKLLRKFPPTRALAKFFKCWRQNGFKYTMGKVKSKLSHRKDYSSVRRPLYTKSELAAQRKHEFPRDIKFSILVPLYNTPKKFLREMIQSVIDQTYANWELCLADGSDKKHKKVGKIAKRYAHRDKRIIYKKLEKNMGISLNTNECIKMSSGDYIGLFDHDDLLHPAALYDVMCAICERGADFIYTDENTFHKDPRDAYCPHFKPDYAPDTLRTNNYICHFSVFKKSLVDEVGMFRSECDGSQDFDMVLRLTEKAECIVHIPKILYYWRAHAASVASDVSAKPYVITAAHKAIADHLERVGLKGEVLDTVVPSMYRIKYEIEGEPKVSVIIANKDHIEDLDKCIKSIITKSTYKNYEIIVVENNSAEPATFEYYRDIERKHGVRIVTWDGGGKFNYSAINNYGVEKSQGDYVILLNNDTEIISPEWIEEMLMFCQREDVGAVGAKLYYPDDTIQHAGLGIGLLTLAGHYFRGFPRSHPGYMGRLIYAHNVSGVTAACVMLPRRVWDELSGLDETFEVAFNDVDLCMRVRKAGYLIVWTPFAELYHYESKSRGLDDDPVKRERFVGEVTRFQTKWRAELDAGDPYYNPNFTLDREDFTIR